MLGSLMDAAMRSEVANPNMWCGVCRSSVYNPHTDSAVPAPSTSSQGQPRSRSQSASLDSDINSHLRGILNKWIDAITPVRRALNHCHYTSIKANAA